MLKSETELINAEIERVRRVYKEWKEEAMGEIVIARCRELIEQRTNSVFLFDNILEVAQQELDYNNSMKAQVESSSKIILKTA